LASRALPVLAEVDESLTLDPADVERKITPRTRAILPVTCAARPRDERARGDREEARSRLIEDVCQAAGAHYRGPRLGTFGDAAPSVSSTTRSSPQVRAAC